MKKLFLLILASGIIISACKKEEIKETKNNTLVLFKKDTLIDGFKGDLFLNTSFQQYIFKVSKTFNKFLEGPGGKATGTYHVSTEGTSASCVVIKYMCDGEPTNCYISSSQQIVTTCN